ncbi:MAG: ABC transporter permease subunit [Gammaproteobacteria bacterium]
MKLSRRSLVIGLPYAWLALFFLLPCLIVLKIFFAEQLVAQPPYSPLFERLANGELSLALHLDSWRLLLTDSLYLHAYLGSIRVALVTTGICLLLGYPMAYAIVRAPRHWRMPLLFAVILPFWTSFLLRVYAWIGLLNQHGVINELLLATGLTDAPLQFLYTPFAVYVGLVYGYLPFMVLPLYAILEKLDPTLLEAAADLGCRPWRAFLTITLPLSLPGLIAGSALVFLPVLGEFVIPDLLGGPDTLMIGKVLWSEFFANRAWPMAAAIAVAMLVLVIVTLMLQRQATRRMMSA